MICYRCGQPIAADEENDRHTDEETGEDIHERCCDYCYPELRAQYGTEELYRSGELPRR